MPYGFEKVLKDFFFREEPITLKDFSRYLVYMCLPLLVVVLPRPPRHQAAVV